jgi:gliding motility-associated-like protein
MKCLYFLVLVLAILPFQHLISQTFNGVGGLPIPPGAPTQTVGITSSTANVSGIGILGGCVQIANVTINLTHTFVGDIALFLIGPGGQVLELSSDNGGGGDNYINTVFTDLAGQFITSGAPPYTGVFRPEGRQQSIFPPFDNTPALGTFTFQNTFDGTNADGVWTFLINDHVAIDVGVLNSWSITFTSGGTPPVVNAGPDLTICPGQNATLTATSNPVGTTYSWSNSASTQSITVSPVITTNYTVTVTTASGCTGTDEVTVNVNPNAADVDAGPDVSICSGQNTNLTATGGSPTATYSWSSGQNTSNITVSPATTTTYTVTVNESGCTDTDNVTVNVTPQPDANAGPDQTLCSGQSLTLTASGGSPSANYNWSDGQSGASINVSPLSSTNYTVTISENGCSDTDDVLVTVVPQPSVNAGADASLCFGQSTTLIATGGPGTFTWSNGASGNSIVVSPSSTQDYSVTVTTANGCTAEDEVTVTVTSIVADAGPDEIICAGQFATLSASGGNTFSWSNGETTPIINVNPATTTVFTVTVSENGCQGTASATVTVQPLPNAQAGLDQTICDGITATLNASGGQSYSWSDGQSGATIQTSPSVTTIYSVTVTNGNCGDTDEVTVFVNPTPDVSADFDSDICAGESVTLTASGLNGPGTYAWSNGQTGPSILVSPSISTNYTVTATNSFGCSGSDGVLVTVNPLPVANAGSDVSICSGNAATLTASGGQSYDWSDGQSGSVISVSPTTTTIYTVTVTTGSGCTDDDQVTVLVQPSPVANAGADASICDGENAILQASGGGTYLWSTGQGIPLITVTPSVTTSYTVTVTNTAGCTDEAEATVFVQASPAADAGPDLDICSGETATLLASGGGSYLWSNGQTTPAITVSPSNSTNYSVTVTNGGCSATDEAVVTVNAIPVANAGPNVSIATGENATLTATGGGAYLWSTGETTPSITVSPTATTPYSVTVTVNGCESQDEVIVFVNEPPLVNLGPDEIICAGESVTLTAAGSVPNNTTFLWSNGQSTNQITVSPFLTTNYSVTLTANNLTSADTITVFVSQAPIGTPAINGTAILCEGETTNYQIQPIAGATGYTWTTPVGATIASGQGTTSISVNWSGDVSGNVSVLAFNDCGQTTGLLPVQINQPPTAPGPINGDAAPCAQNTATYTINSVNGATQYNWTVTGGALITGGQGTTAVQVDWNNSSGGQLCVNAENPCGVSAPVCLDVTTLPGPVSNAGNDLALCGITGTLGASGSGSWALLSGPGSVNFSDANNPVSDVTASQPGNYVFTWTVAANGCTATDEASVIFQPYPSVTSVVEDCNDTNTAYTISINLADGTAPYFVDGNEVTGSVFTSLPIASGGNYSFAIADANGCPATTVSGSNNCDCTTNAGEMSLAPLSLCEGEPAVASFLGGGTFDGDDVAGYALHTGVVPAGVLFLSNSPVFPFDNSLSFETPYYISVIVGSNDGTGLPDLTDPCLSYSPGTPATWHELPEAVAMGSATLCKGDCTEVEISFTGNAPFVFNYSNNAGNQSLSSIANQLTQTLCLTASDSWTLLSVTDAHCQSGLSGVLDFTVNAPPFADVVAADEVCNTTVSGFPTERDFSQYLLAGDMGGVWADVDNSGASGTFPLLNFEGVTPGVYTFLYSTLSAQAPCMEASYEVEITVTDNCLCPPVNLLPAAPLCNTAGNSINLNTLVAAGTAAGSWALLSTPGAGSTAAVAGSQFLTNGSLPGDYVLEYTLFNVPGICPPSATVILTLSAPPNAGAPLPPVSFCENAGQIVLLNDLLANETTGGVWSETSTQPSTGGAFNAAAGSFDAASQAAANYQFTYTVAGQNGCPDATASVNVLVNPNPVANAGPDQQIDCLLPSVPLSGNGSSTGGGVSYQWSNGAATINTTADQPGVYSLTVTNANGCTATDEVEVTTDLNFPVAVINSSDEVFDCNVESITLDGNASTPTNLVYEWMFNNIVISTANSLIVSDPGCYSLRVTNPQNSCADLKTYCLPEENTPPAIMLNDPGELTCVVATATLDASGSGGGSSLLFAWATGNGNIVSGENTPVCIVDAAGTYSLSVTNLENGCVSTETVIVVENKTLPIAAAEAASSLDCVTAATALSGNGSSAGVNFSYAWTTTNGSISGDASQINAIASAPGDYALLVTNTENGCTASASTQVVQLTDDPSEVIIAVVQPLCFEDCNGSITFDDKGKGYVYSFDNQGFGNAASFLQLCDGSYQVVVKDAFGCEWDTLLSIQSPGELQIDLGPDQTIQLGDSVRLSPAITAAFTDLAWSPAETGSCAEPCLNPWVAPQRTTSYSATVADENGCTASDQLTIFVEKKRPVFVPNAFSPNDDGLNDKLIVFAGQEVKAIKSFLIFSRWGEMVFQYLNPEPGNPDHGWDGTFNSTQMNPAVFVYLVEVEYIDGETEILSGDVTLVR